LAEQKKTQWGLRKQLRRKGRRSRTRGNSKDFRGEILVRVGIEQRPKEAEIGELFGYFEVDKIIGKDHKGAIITLI
jgi:IS30 family transposase